MTPDLPPELLEMLSVAAPEIGIPLEAAEAASSEAKSFAYELARQAGLTAEDDYRGWIPVLILLYKFVWPPIQTALHIENQIAGVLDQLYGFLGGIGAAAEAGAKSVVSALETVGSDEEYVFSGQWL